MITDFEAYAEVLRKIGNQRLPYTIFVDIDSALNEQLMQQKSGIMLAVDKQILLADGVKAPNAMAMKTKRYFANIDDMLNAIMTCNETVCIVFGHTNILTSKAAIIFNEVHSNAVVASKAWHLSFSGDGYTAFTRRIFNNPEIISMQVEQKFAKELQQLPNVAEFKPWHTVLYNKTTHCFVQIVWDTRVIVGAGKLETAEQIDTMLKSKNCNDNSFLLYNSIGQPAIDAGFEDYIINDIQLQ